MTSSIIPSVTNHSWNLSPKEAVMLQRKLASMVKLQPLPESFEVLAAADVSYIGKANSLIAVIVTFLWPDLSLLESIHVVEKIRFPYIPGLLSFREIPPLISAYGKLKRKPDVFLCDGQGIAHPRRFGLASHLGVVLGIPTVGCAKSKLAGKHEPLELKRGNYKTLVINGEPVGYIFCSRSGVKPIYISPGHLADLPSARVLITKCLGPYRIPQPLRIAHKTATDLRRKYASNL